MFFSRVNAVETVSYVIWWLVFAEKNAS